LGNPSWEENFAKPQAVKMILEEKSGQETTSSIRYQVRSEPAGSDSVKIVSLDESGKEISVSNLEKSAWKSNHGNWIRFYFALTESYGFKLSVQKITKVKAQTQVNGVRLEVDALEVQASGKNQLGWMIEQVYIVTNKIRGVGGLLLRSETQPILGQKILRTRQVTSIDE
jgi:hypothetical protein